MHIHAYYLGILSTRKYSSKIKMLDQSSCPGTTKNCGWEEILGLKVLKSFLPSATTFWDPQDASKKSSSNRMHDSVVHFFPYWLRFGAGRLHLHGSSILGESEQAVSSKCNMLYSLPKISTKNLSWNVSNFSTIHDAVRTAHRRAYHVQSLKEGTYLFYCRSKYTR